MSESAVITLVIVLTAAAAAVTVRVAISIRNRKNTYKVVQKNNVVHGDQAGRDINKSK